MNKLELFNECLRGGYNNTIKKVSSKIKNKIGYFQCSKEKQDWIYNFLFIPAIIKIRGCYLMVPLGLKIMWDEIKNNNEFYFVDGFTGYSLGAELASLWSFARSVPAIVFGCPNFLLFPSKKVLDGFSGVTFCENPNDVVTKIPPVYRKGNNIVVLGGRVNKEHIETIEDLFQEQSGHSPTEYRQRLEYE